MWKKHQNVMLQEIITDKNFVWDKFSLNNSEFLVTISKESIAELKDNRSVLLIGYLMTC